jgi:hypothetical protein
MVDPGQTAASGGKHYLHPVPSICSRYEKAYKSLKAQIALAHAFKACNCDKAQEAGVAALKPWANLMKMPCGNGFLNGSLGPSSASIAMAEFAGESALSNLASIFTPFIFAL